MKNVLRKIKDSHFYAYWCGFYERTRYYDGFGRTHATDQSWNEAYDAGANLSDKLLDA